VGERTHHQVPQPGVPLTMNVMSEVLADVVSPLKKLEMALQQEQTEGGKRDADFKEAYPVIEQHLLRKVSQRKVMASFNSAYGHKLYLPGFRKMLKLERKRRSESGEHAQCSACGQRLHSIEDPPDGAVRDAT
jgi:hypothetical protein